MTAIGDAVNFASRIESANKQAETCFLISEETYQKVKDLIRAGKRVELPIAGKTGCYTLYEVTGLSEP
jgi:adenylate cyclase